MKLKIKNMNKGLLISIVICLLVVIVGTYAWLTWRSKETALVLTVGDINNVKITLSPYKIDASILPALTYEGEEYTNVEATNNSFAPKKFQLFYSIDEISSELVNTNFRYTITKSTNGGTTYTEYKSGNFSSAVVGEDLVILSEDIPANTSYKYKVYVWLYGENGDSGNTVGKTFVGDLNAKLDNTNNIVVDINDGLIPVTIANDGAVSSVSRTDSNWYDYSNKKWANAVLVKNSNVISALDYSSYKRNGTLYNTSFSDDGLVFNGTTSYVSPSNFGVTLPATYSVKFKLNSLGNQIIFGDYNTKIGLGIYNSGAGLIVSLNQSTNVVNTGGLTTGKVYNVDIVANSLSNIKVYLDGKLLAASSATNNWGWEDTNSYIGKRAAGTYFNGTIERIIVYDDALTTDEINHNLNVDDFKVCDTGIVCDNLSLYYNFKGGIRDYYGNNLGNVTIPLDSILAYFVYVPRYSYKLWTVNASATTSPQEIEISFENKSMPKNKGNTVGSYLTHPAFTFGDKEVNGIWVGKFETTQGTSDNIGTTNPTILPGIAGWGSQDVSAQFDTSLKFTGSSLTNKTTITYGTGTSIYGLKATNYDSHMMKNSEWGAAAYLSHSKYGINAEIQINTSSNSTGNGNSSTNTYGNGNSSYPQSTTGNISGIFDMSGGKYEYVMGNYNNTVYVSAFNQSFFTQINNQKYYDLYNIDDFRYCDVETCGGQALSETASWYYDYADFVYSSNPWFLRGGSGSGSFTGAFFFTYGDGYGYNGRGFRVVLLS